MSNTERRPTEVVGGPGPARVQVLAAREVPLGGPRAMRVRRTLPARGRSLIGAWCFVDHYGPDLVAPDPATRGMTTPRRSSTPPLRSSVEQRRGGPGMPTPRRGPGMRVPPHPHTGLQTVSWLFAGEIEHRDSAGHHAVVRPGELNLMTAGRGISHSEVSTAGTSTLHGVQLWVALPDAARHGDPGFEHHVPPVVRGEGVEARVFLGSLLGATSPVVTATPLLGAEVLMEPGVRVRLDVDPAFEHGVLVDRGRVSVAGVEVAPSELTYLPPGAPVLELLAAQEPVRLLLLGGPPFGESIVMWWNFVGRSHEEVVAFREQWQGQVAEDGGYRDGPFGIPVGSSLPPIPAPDLPHVRLRARG